MRLPLMVLLRLAFALLIVVDITPAANAQTYYWDTNSDSGGFGGASGIWGPAPGGSTNWSTSSTGDVIPGTVITTTSDTLHFGTSTDALGAGTITVGGVVDAGNLTFGAASGAIVLSGGTINLGATSTIEVANATNTISSILSGAGTSLIKSGSGTLVLTAENTFGGAINVSAGTLAVTATVAGNYDRATNVSASATYQYSTAATIIPTIASAMTIDGTLNKRGAGGLILNGAISGSGTISLADAGSLTLNGNNSGFSGPVQSATGTLTLGSANALGTGTLTMTSGTLQSGVASLVNAGNNPIVVAGNFTFGGTNSLNLGTGAVTLTGNRTITTNFGLGLVLGGNIGEDAAGRSLTKAGPGVLILAGTNTYSGTTIAGAGTLVGINAVQSFGTNLSGIIVQAAGTLSMRNDSTVAFTNGTSAYNITNSASGATINVDRISGTGSNTITVGNLTTSSAATTWVLNFTGANGVSLSAGTLLTPIAATVTHTINNNIGGGGTLTLATVNNRGTGASPDLFFSGTGNTIVTGPITQTVAAMELMKTGTGSLTLSGLNTYTGLTSVRNGTLTLSGGNANSGNIWVSNDPSNFSSTLNQSQQR
ncbi:MAG: beta strand repeat-containing protein [Gemmataceae bacterium]